MIGNINDSTLIYSHYKARPYIKGDVFKSIIKNYKFLKNGPYTVTFKDIKVTGVLNIIRKPKIIYINYYYQSVEYADTLVEIYKKPPLKLKNNKKIAKRR